MRFILKIIIIFVLLISLSTCYPHSINTWILIERVDITKNQHLLLFKSLSGKYQKRMIVDTSWCKIGDTVFIKKLKKNNYIKYFKNS
jgi:hypothetical protein